MSSFSLGSKSAGNQQLPGTKRRTYGKKLALLGDPSSYGGTIISTNQNDNALSDTNVLVSLENALHSCPLSRHGVTQIRAVTVRSFHNGKLILTENAVAGCGAVIQPPDRGVYVE